MSCNSRAVDLHSPFLGGVIQNHLEGFIDFVAGSEHFVEFHLADDVAQRGLGQLFDGVGEIGYLVHHPLGIHDLIVKQGVDLGDDVVFGVTFCLGKSNTTSRRSMRLMSFLLTSFFPWASS